MFRLTTVCLLLLAGVCVADERADAVAAIQSAESKKLDALVSYGELDNCKVATDTGDYNLSFEMLRYLMDIFNAAEGYSLEDITWFGTVYNNALYNLNSGDDAFDSGVVYYANAESYLSDAKSALQGGDSIMTMYNSMTPAQQAMSPYYLTMAHDKYNLACGKAASSSTNFILARDSWDDTYSHWTLAISQYWQLRWFIFP